MDLSPICRCGVRRDRRGVCPHCDTAPLCTVGCVACRTRDSLCVVCRADCGTPVAAEYHQKGCRAAEQKKAA